ncbi:MAG: MATE family efflux transporter [Lachnospiraceae bacterium]|nr:MATE family efflux transporter [Lachnospiraceae bacterium]
MAQKKDMTAGKITLPLIAFTIPLVLGNLFQLTYNAADSVIVGHYVGEGALAAVGTSAPLMNIVLLLISGLCMGASILMSAQYGSKDYGLLSRQISTTFLAGCGFSVLFSVITIALADPLLILIRVPEEVRGEAGLYLRIIFVGILFTFIYNFLANTLRALGDSRTPLYFLIISAILNIFGDILLVATFGLGVMGSAVSTVISEAVCCLLCAVYIKKKIPLLCLGRGWLVFDRKLLRKTIAYGSTSAMQQVCLQIGKTVIQAMVNTRGVSVMAAFTAVNRVDDFAYTPQQNIGHAMTTFIAQNKGANHRERIRKGFQSGILIEIVYSFFICGAILFAAPFIMNLFTDSKDAEVVSLGVSYLRRIAFMYLLPGFTNGIQGFFRGMGDLKVTLYSTSMNMLGRVAAVYLLLMVFSVGFISLAWANFAGWIVMLLFEVPLLIRQLKWLAAKEQRQYTEVNQKSEV